MSKSSTVIETNTAATTTPTTTTPTTTAVVAVKTEEETEAKPSGRRGYWDYNGTKGWWITLEDAKQRGGNTRWWELMDVDGQIVDPKQQSDPSGPLNKPVWYYENGNMYMGTWKKNSRTKRHVEDGFGVCCMQSHEEVIGKVYVGGWKNGYCEGRGTSSWLPNCRIWTENVELGNLGVPYIYRGNFVKNQQNDDNATVILKDGTTRVGPWKNNQPVGDWFKDHRIMRKTNTKRKRMRKISSPSRKTRSLLRKKGTSNNNNKDTKKSAVPGIVAAVKPENVPSDDNSVVEVKKEAVQQEVINVADSPREAGKGRSRESMIRDLKDWMLHLVGLSFSEEDMEVYARKFHDVEGLTPNDIEELCTVRDIKDFDWMKPFHKKKLIQVGKMNKK